LLSVSVSVSVSVSLSQSQSQSQSLSLSLLDARHSMLDSLASRAAMEGVPGTVSRRNESQAPGPRKVFMAAFVLSLQEVKNGTPDEVPNVRGVGGGFGSWCPGVPAFCPFGPASHHRRGRE
jgi:hypothetical protein